MSVWERVRPLLSRALDKSGEGTLKQVRDALESGQSQLWTSKDEKTAVVTEHTQDLNIWLYAGNFDEIKELDDSAAEYARTLGMGNMIVWDGRKGWKRALKHLGYTEKTILVKEL